MSTREHTAPGFSFASHIRARRWMVLPGEDCLSCPAASSAAGQTIQREASGGITRLRTPTLVLRYKQCYNYIRSYSRVEGCNPCHLNLLQSRTQLVRLAEPLRFPARQPSPSPAAASVPVRPLSPPKADLLWRLRLNHRSRSQSPPLRRRSARRRPQRHGSAVHRPPPCSS